MTLLELAEAACRRVAATDDATKDVAKEFVKRRYKSLYDKYPWLDAHDTFQFRTTTNEIILPDWCERIVQVREDNAEDARNLQMVARQTVMVLAPGALDGDGERVAYSQLPSVATHTHPGGNQLTVQSSSTADTAQTVRVRGRHNGLRIEETIQLAGTTPVTSTYYYDEITGLSKPATTGSLTIDNTAATPAQLQVLLPHETERRHIRMQLHYDYATGADEEVITVLCKRRCVELRHDNDTPQISNLDDSLIAFALADLLERERQFAKATVKTQEAVALANEMLLAEREQQQNHIQIIPDLFSYADESAIY